MAETNEVLGVADKSAPGFAEQGAQMIAAERARQVSVEGWTPEHDDQATNGSLAIAAACYAISATDIAAHPDETHPDAEPNG